MIEGNDARVFTERYQFRDFVLHIHYVGMKFDIVPRTEYIYQSRKAKLAVPILLRWQSRAAVSERVMIKEVKVKSDENIHKGHATMRMNATRSHGGDESRREANDVCSKSNTEKCYRATRVLAGINERSECFARVVASHAREIRELLQLGQELCVKPSVV